MILDEGLYARVFKGWASKDYILLEEWVCGCEGATWNYNGGRSIINGVVYHDQIFFDTEEDMIVCKLKFPDMITLYNV